MLGSLQNPSQLSKKVLVVRQDLKMGAGKIASQCAHAATGMYSELMQRFDNAKHRITSFIQALKLTLSLISAVPFEAMGAMWTTQNSCHMQESTRNVSRNKLKEAAENIGLPTFVVADAGRTQVSAGSKTVLAIGPATIFMSLNPGPFIAHEHALVNRRFQAYATNISRSVSQMGSLQSLLPLHTAVSSARLTSCLGIDSKGSRSLSQGMLCSANPGV
ncbi:hypothetical protein TEA_000622 [Camellia sinensis var. sinensis]|uniref:peptidyl-tRNA hydrolase n=1 Tax=Camellia sinensis var. sinensis TaxID=542762 RepID=A0A4S4ET80_CAMSN|nr:hypothetical protein TEA_000622 [Camellia sinensis var. sinensis]